MVCGCHGSTHLAHGSSVELRHRDSLCGLNRRWRGRGPGGYPSSRRAADTASTAGVCQNSATVSYGSYLAPCAGTATPLWPWSPWSVTSLVAIFDGASFFFRAPSGQVVRVHLVVVVGWLLVSGAVGLQLRSGVVAVLGTVPHCQAGSRGPAPAALPKQRNSDFLCSVLLVFPVFLFPSGFAVLAPSFPVCLAVGWLRLVGSLLAPAAGPALGLWLSSCVLGLLRVPAWASWLPASSEPGVGLVALVASALRLLGASWPSGCFSPPCWVIHSNWGQWLQSMVGRPSSGLCRSGRPFLHTAIPPTST